MLFIFRKRSPTMSLLSHQLTGRNSINKTSFNEALRSYPHEVLLMSLGSPYVFTGSGTIIDSKGLHVLCLRAVFKIEVFNALRSSNAIWPFKVYLSQNNPSKRNSKLKMKDVTWSPQYNMPVTRTNKRRGLSLQEVELGGWFVILCIILETCII